MIQTMMLGGGVLFPELQPFYGKNGVQYDEGTAWKAIGD